MSDITVVLANPAIGANLTNTPVIVDVQSTTAPILVDVTGPAMTVSVAAPSEIDVTLSGVGQAGSPGPPGPAGDGGFTYTQSSPAATWTITHTLGRKPASVTVWLDDVIVDTDVETPDTATVVLTFASPQSGRAEII